MSDKPIQVGDLVQVVRPTLCCGQTKAIGMIYQVVSFNSMKSYKCDSCGGITNLLVADRGFGWGANVCRLKRIPPLSELESRRTEEVLREPACN